MLFYCYHSDNNVFFYLAEPAIRERAAELEQIQTARLALDSDHIKGNQLMVLIVAVLQITKFISALVCFLSISRITYNLWIVKVRKNFWKQ